MILDDDWKSCNKSWVVQPTTILYLSLNNLKPVASYWCAPINHPQNSSKFGTQQSFRSSEDPLSGGPIGVIAIGFVPNTL